MSHIDLSAEPKNVPKKIPWYKFLKKYPKIYKNCTLVYGDGIVYNYFSIKKENITKEYAKELLDDLIIACNMVERGEYEIK